MKPTAPRCEEAQIDAFATHLLASCPDCDTTAWPLENGHAVAFISWRCEFAHLTPRRSPKHPH